MIFQNWRKLFTEKTPLPPLALAALFVPLAFSHFTYEKFETVKFAVFYFLLGWALWRAASQKQLRYNRNAVAWLGAAVLLSILATVVSADPLFSLFGRSLYWVGCIFLIGWALMVCLLVDQLDEARLKQLFSILLAGAAINAGLGILQAYGIGYYESPYTIGYLLRPPALFGNPNYAAMFLAALAPVAIWFAAAARTFLGRVRYHLAAFLLVFATMILSSRGAILGLFSGLSVLGILLLIRKEWREALTAAGYGALSAGLYELFTGPFRNTYTGTAVFDTGQNNVIERLNFLSHGWQIISRQPWLGIGFGNLTGSTHDLHNYFLNLAVSAGVPFALTMLGLVLYVAVLGWRRVRNNAFNAALLAALAGFLVASSFNPVTLPNWLLLGIVLAGLIYPFVDSKIAAPPKTAIAVGTVLAAFGISLILSQAIYYAASKKYLFHRDYAGAMRLLNWSLPISVAFDMDRAQAASLDIHLNASGDSVRTKIQKYGRLHGADPDVQLAAGRLYYQLFLRDRQAGDLRAAEESSRQAIRLAPENPSGYFYLAGFLAAAGEQAQAQQALDQGLAAAPDNALLWAERINGYIASGNSAAVLRSLEVVYRYYPNDKRLKHLLQNAKNGVRISPFSTQIPESPYATPGSLFSNDL